MSNKIKKLKHVGGHLKKKKQDSGAPGEDVLLSRVHPAMTLHQAGHLPQAEALYRQILLSDPSNHYALHFLGLLAHQLGRDEIAVEMLNQALTFKPDYAEAHNTQGNVFLAQGKLNEAAQCFRLALACQPGYAASHFNLGRVLQLLRKPAEAIECFRQALALKPDYAEAHCNLGYALKIQGNLDEAVISYRRALTLKPDYADAHYSLGVALQAQGKLDEAIASYCQALTFKPDLAEAQNNLGLALMDKGCLDEALASFRQALTLQPDYALAHSNLLLSLNYFAGMPVSHYLDEAKRFGRNVTGKVSARFSDWSCSAKPERLRVGLVSSNLLNHPVGYFLENILANRDPAQIELIAYPTHHREDALTARVRPLFSAWNSIAGMTDEAAARLIHDDGVHVLLDLSGHTGANRLPVFSWKPAPVQGTWLGYFASTGMAEMDYLIADPVSVPETHQGQFTERVWYLPETRFCFSPPEGGEELRTTPLPALHNGYITFGCFQNVAKINDEVLAVWGRILDLLPSAKLRLQNLMMNFPASREQLQGRLTRSGIAAERVMLERPVSRREYLEAHAHIDIILDTFPFSGGTTTCEAFWMGVPTVTLAGNTMVARQGASLLACAGLSDWVAVDEDDYIAKALGHSADLEKLRLRAGLRQQVLASPLMDGPRFARNFETAMWGMWRRFRADEEENHNKTKK